MESFFAQIKDGTLKFQNLKEYAEFLVAHDGESVIVDIKKRKKARSKNQNDYLWGGVYPIVLQGLRDVGMDEIKSKEEVHLLCKLKFLCSYADLKSGDSIPIIGRTSQLTPTEFAEFIENIARWAAEYLNCVIPPPNTQTDLAY